MTLEFLNPSRSFDEDRNAIRFIGHDGMFEVRFFVEVEALARTKTAFRGKEISNEMYLSAFDSSLREIHEVARKAYSRDRRNSQTLTSDSFR